MSLTAPLRQLSLVLLPAISEASASLLSVQLLVHLKLTVWSTRVQAFLRSLP